MRNFYIIMQCYMVVSGSALHCTMECVTWCSFLCTARLCIALCMQCVLRHSLPCGTVCDGVQGFIALCKESLGTVSDVLHVFVLRYGMRYSAVCGAVFWYIMLELFG